MMHHHKKEADGFNKEVRAWETEEKGTGNGPEVDGTIDDPLD